MIEKYINKNFPTSYGTLTNIVVTKDLQGGSKLNSEKSVLHDDILFLQDPFERSHVNGT